jgi:hypothetical protein
MALHSIHFIGPLRAILDAATGEVIAVQDRISGLAASLCYRPETIASAIAKARLAHEATADFLL